MFLQKKALYNLIQLNVSRIQSGEIEIVDLQSWQVENYREKRTEELFHELHTLGIHLIPEDFENYGKQFEAPEEIVETLAFEREPLEKDRIYLIFFELWRRFFPEKRTISIFCDELDHQMISYDLQKPNEIPDALAALQILLDEHVDQGLDPAQAFQQMQLFCANDIESFLFDYILAEIESSNEKYASELLEGFGRYVPNSCWFAYLNARNLILEEPIEGYEKLEGLIEKLNPESNLELVEEMLFFLANTGNHSLFYTLTQKAVPLLKTEEDFKIFLEACYVHYDYLELPEQALGFARLYYCRASVPNNQMFSHTDPILVEAQGLLQQKLHFAEE